MWFARFILNADRDGFQLLRAQLSKTPRQQSCELRMVRNDGTQFWANLVCSAQRKVGEIEFDMMLSDISERKRTEAAMEESREKFRGLSEAAFEAVFISEDGKCLEQNTRAQEMFGYTADEAVGRYGTGWIAPHDRDRVLQNMMSGYEQPYEVTGLRKDGSIFPAVIRGKMMHYQGKTVRVTTMADSTELKRAENALRLAASVFTHAREGISIADPSGTIIDINEAFTRITGYRRDEVLGRNLRILQSGRHGKEFYTAMWCDLREKGHWSGELWNRRKSGEEYALGITISAVPNDRGVVHQYVVLFSDISERKRMEQQVHRLAFYDPLTQLPNRRLLSDRLNQTMAASKRSGLYCALMFVDLDNFKPLNDAHGHGVGDLLLVEAARRLTACVREVDTVARFGGDEFVVLLGELAADREESSAQTRIVAEKIRVSLAVPYRLQVQHAQHAEGAANATVEHCCTASIGVVVFVNHEASQDEIFKWADAAMYRAKDTGRNAIRFDERP